MENTKNVKMGFFVVLGTIFLAVALYMVGAQRSLFKPTITINALFRNINGLQTGNNIRFAGIDVGSVEKVEILNDSTVLVKMSIDKEVAPMINKSSVVSVGTDGLMGNKIVNINFSRDVGRKIHPGDTLHSLNPIESDEMMRTLNETNDNINLITKDLKNITAAISHGKGGAWKVFTDTTMALNLQHTMKNIEFTTAKAANVASEISGITNDVKRGKGIAGYLLYDSTFKITLQRSLTDLSSSTAQLAQITVKLSDFSGQIQNGKGPLGVLLNDSASSRDLKKAIENVKNAADNFNQNMEALKQSSLLKNYFKTKREKAK